MWRQLLLVSGLAVALGGCAAGFLPEGGPGQAVTAQSASVQVGSREEQGALPFVLVTPTVDLAARLPGEPDRFGSVPKARQAEIRARPGDLVQVTIFEAGAGGLFTSPQSTGSSGGGGNYINLPAQAITPAGTISVPYAGTVSVVGRTMTAVQQEIQARLKDRAIEPQVIVTVQEERASFVSVLGNVRAGGMFPVRNTKMRLLDAIARAGGVETSTRPYEVVLQRNGQTARIAMRSLVLDASANAAVLPGDTIYVNPISRAVNVFGASGENNRVDIDMDRMNLSDVLGRAKGFNDTRADISSIFVLRMEDRRYIPEGTENLAALYGSRVPTVYQIRYDTPGGIFVGNHFRVRNGDVVYISNASGVQLRKLLELIGLVTRPAREIQGGFITN